MYYRKFFLKNKFLLLSLFCLNISHQLLATTNDPFQTAESILEHAQPKNSDLQDFGTGVLAHHKVASKLSVQNLFEHLFNLGKINFKQGFDVAHLYQSAPANTQQTYFTSDTGAHVDEQGAKQILKRAVKEATNMYINWHGQSGVQNSPTIEVWCTVNFVVGKQYADNNNRSAVKIIFDNRNNSTDPNNWFVFDAYPVNPNQIPGNAVHLQ